MTAEFRQQRTIATSVSVTGYGFWSGRDITVTFCPADIDTGIVFIRTDVGSPARIKAHAINRIEMPRRTSLRHGACKVEMVEHVMAALAGLRIDNCEVLVDNAEMPGLDGSCKPLVDALLSAGIEQQLAPRPSIVIDEVIRVGTSDCWVEARPTSDKEMTIGHHLDYGHNSPIAKQSFQAVLNPVVFQQELASARTFILLKEAQQLQSQGLAGRASFEDLLVFGTDGPINNRLRFRDECARHKALDLVGDLALSNCDLYGQFIGYRSGHRLNAQLVGKVLAKYQGDVPDPGSHRNPMRLSA